MTSGFSAPRNTERTSIDAEEATPAIVIMK